MKVVIIGGVAGGMSAASKLKRSLKDKVEVVVFEQYGDVSYGACGIPYYISGHIKDPRSLIAREPEQFIKQGIDLRLYHQVLKVDTDGKKVRVLDKENNTEFSESYDYLIVASGARVREFPPFNTKAENLMSVRNITDSVAIMKKLVDGEHKEIVIVGGGFIGVEMAEAVKSHEANVTIVEFADSILNDMDEEISEMLKGIVEENGINLMLSNKVVALNQKDGKIVSVDVESANGEKQTIPADMVINSAGIAPNTEIIDTVDKAGNGAIMVDENMETSVKGVYAAGDCSIMRSSLTGEYQYSPLGDVANKQGRIVAEILSGETPQRFRLIGSNCMKLFDYATGKAGLSEKAAKAQGIPYKTNTITAASYTPSYCDDKVTIKLVYHSATRKILGAQLVGKGAVAERVNYFVIAIYSGLTVDEYGFLDLAYAPPFNSVWDATLIAGNTSK